MAPSWILSCVKPRTVTWWPVPGTHLRPGTWLSSHAPFFLQQSLATSISLVLSTGFQLWFPIEFLFYWWVLSNADSLKSLVLIYCELLCSKSHTVSQSEVRMKLLWQSLSKLLFGWPIYHHNIIPLTWPLLPPIDSEHGPQSSVTPGL